jgi:hypothetical protein
MVIALAMATVMLAALYLLALGIACVAAPTRASRFLSGFATSARVHVIEMAARLAVGAALLVYAPRLPWPSLFVWAGWLLVGTTVVLLAIPWRWHQRFAERVVPQALRYLPLVGIVSVTMGAGLLAAVVVGAPASGA